MFKRSSTMRLFSYIVASDTGFAPNPYHHICTLACCKPKVRRVARVGDLVIGLSGKKYGNKLIYAMQVTETPSFEEYWQNPKYLSKRSSQLDETSVRGDNIYEKLPSGLWKQNPAVHPNRKHGGDMDLDLGLDETNTKDPRNKVLVSDRFVYYGREPITLPEPILSKVVVGWGHRSRFEPSFIEEVMDFIEGNNQWGLISPPGSLKQSSI